MNILIVEDEAMNAHIMELSLQQSGHTVVNTVASGEEALQFLFAESVIVDLIMMDIWLDGELDGIETVMKIHEKTMIPVVYVTASTDEETFSRACKTQMNGYLKKPFTQEELLQFVEKAV